MAKPKEAHVKIISISSTQVTGGAIMQVYKDSPLDGKIQSVIHVFGLGEDGKVYQWDIREGTWFSYSTH